MIFKVICARIILALMLFASIYGVYVLVNKTYLGKIDKLPDAVYLINAEDELKPNYRISDSGHIEIHISGSYYLIQCNFFGWSRQEQYLSLNLPAISDGCNLVE